MEIPNPETFGVPEPKPHESINPDDYHSLFEWEK